MCFVYGIKASKAKIEKHFDAKFDNDFFTPTDEINGFLHPAMPLIVDKAPNLITAGIWGLMPVWAKDFSFQKNTLNARFETLYEKPSFKNVVNNRCLIPATNFYEWQWLDEKGKNKVKYSIETENELFAFAGLYSIWGDSNTNNKYLTYSIITTQANEVMSKIHNTKQRMPIIIQPDNYNNWLNSNDYKIDYFEQIPIKLFPLAV